MSNPSVYDNSKAEHTHLDFDLTMHMYNEIDFVSTLRNHSHFPEQCPSLCQSLIHFESLLYCSSFSQFSLYSHLFPRSSSSFLPLLPLLNFLEPSFLLFSFKILEKRLQHNLDPVGEPSYFSLDILLSPAT